MVSNANGTVAQTAQYDAFGNVVNSTVTGAAGYQGEQFDPSNGLIYLRARYYDPATGRFMSKDPVTGTLANPQTQNGYSYVSNDPINYNDPSGEFLDTIWDIGNVIYDIATCSWGDLSFDAGAALIPFVPAGGTKAIKYGDELYDAGKVTKQTSPVWNGAQTWRGGVKTNGESGSARRYYEWDYTHNDIEVYDKTGNHLGSMDPVSGDMTKPPVPGRSINVR